MADRAASSRRAPDAPAPPMPTVSIRRLLVLCALAGAAALATGVLVAIGPAGAQTLDGRIETRSSRAEALRAAVAAETSRIRASARGLAAAQRRFRALQADSARQEAQLNAIEQELRRARMRLTRLVNRQQQAVQALRANLVAAYRNPKPDVVSVVISAHGFADLLEKADFLKRIADQNANIMAAARRARVAVARQAASLARIQARERRIAVGLERRRDQAQAVATALLRAQRQRVAGRASKTAALRELEDQLAALRKRVARQARAGIRTDAGGTAQAPPGAPPAVALVMAAGNAIAGLPYVYGGGHGSFKANAYDCSGSVSYALAAAGLVSSPMTSGAFMSWGEPGPGRWITVYANAGHAFMIIAGWRFDTSALPGGGTRWARDMRGTAGFAARHPPGL